MLNVEQTIAGFIIDRKAQGLAPGTIRNYTRELGNFQDYLGDSELTPGLIRSYLLFLKDEKKRNSGGVHLAYRCIKTWLYWLEREYDNYTAPIRKVKSPRLNRQPLEPVSLEHVQQLLATCTADYYGIRDKALILILLDTGVRASALLNVNLCDVDTDKGTIAVISKGSKARTLYIGRRTRKALRAWLRLHQEHQPALFTAYDGIRLGYSGLRLMLTRRSKTAGIGTNVTAHQFRRAFALMMLRSGVDIYTLAGLMGHSDTRILERYLRLEANDLELAHRTYSPGDRL